MDESFSRLIDSENASLSRRIMHVNGTLATVRFAVRPKFVDIPILLLIQSGGNDASRKNSAKANFSKNKIFSFFITFPLQKSTRAMF